MKNSDFGAGESLDNMVSGLLGQMAETHASIVPGADAVSGGASVDLHVGGLGSGLLDLPPLAPTVGISTGDAGQPVSEGGNLSADASGGESNTNLGGGVLGTALDIPAWDVVLEEDDVRGGKAGGAPAGDPTGANVAPGGPGTLLTLGTNPDGSHYFTGIRNVDAVLIGSKWGSTNLTYSFPTSGTNYNGSGYSSDGVSLYHVDLGPQQQAAARAAFAQLSAATGLTFTEITDTDTVHANIRLSQTSDQDDASAYGNFASDTSGLAGDIWFGRNNQPYYDLAYKGTWGYATIMHEIGHTMGLKHGHQDYTNSDLSFYFGTSPRFGTQSLTPDRDGQAWSLMTYTPAPFTNSNFAGDKIDQPQTYMQYDLAALQYLYGANYSTHAEDTTYTFSATTGEMFINGVGQGAPAGNKIFLTIWDGGGNDTIDASNYANGVTIDLRPGEFSTVDQNQLANNLAYQNLVNLAPGNFAMSLLYNNDSRSLIENAKGGVGNDIFVGNTANNILDGGAGSDTVIFTNTTGINVLMNNTGADVIVSHDGETDTLRSIENIQGTSGNDSIVGNTQNNTLSGGSGGADILSGGDGDDRLIGGGFSVVNNAIITKAQATANLSAGTAVDPQALNAYTLASDVNTTNSTTTPHATINATSTGGGLEYYRVDAAAGATAIFDIDGSSIDTWIELVDSLGNVLANNDDSITDAGSQTGNSYLTWTFGAAGTYYIRVGRWTQPADTVAQPLAAGTTYTLNMSLSSATVNTTPFSATNTSSATLKGGAGNDFLQGTLGDDIINGGVGNDTASFATAFSNTATGVTVDLHLQGAAQNTVAAGNDTLSGIENLVGSQYNDTLTGDGTNNVIEGGLGNDTLVGGGGTDTASYAGATAGVTVSLGLQGGTQNTVNAGTDTLSGFANLQGSAFNDSLTGDAGLNVLSGGDGNDTLNPGVTAAGIVDLLDGGNGSDTASFAGYTSAVTASLDGVNDAVAFAGGNQIAVLRSIENLTGGSGADTLTGDANNNAIEGGLGDDILVGGGGVDTVVFTGSTAVTLNLATTTAQATGWGNDTISGFQNVRTGSGADNITGDGNDNTFFDGGGGDRYDGAGGSDTVDYTNIATAVTVNLNTTTAQTVSTGNSDTILNIENVVGSLTAANTFTGNALANTFTGGAGIDTVQGNAGNDVIFGGAGNDVLLGGTTGALDDASSDTLYGGAGSDYLSGGQGNDILHGGDGDDSLIGGVGNTLRQYFTGVDGGNDTFDGGDGSDTAIMVLDGRAGVSGSTVGVAFDLRSLAGNSDITENGVSVGTMTSIETLIFRGTNVNDTVGGTGNADNLFGAAGDDALYGWYGNDLLEGGAGNDILDGGEGLDTASYSTATAGVNVDLRTVGAQDTGGAGIDTLSGIEYLTGSTFGDTLKGTDDFNLITDSGVGTGATALSQTDSLFGYGGNDSILVTRGTAAAAVATNINMDGGDGDDMIELRGGTLTGFTLATNVAGLINQTYAPLGATSADRNVDVVNVVGGAGNDRIILTGVASATIDAGTGNDIVSISMRGATSVNNYNITLGDGADIIQFGVGSTSATSTEVMATAHTSRVTDFQVGDAGDKFEMTNYLNFGVLAGSGYVAANGAFASGHMRLVQSGTDLLLQVDRDGAGAVNSFVTVFAISNGYTGGFTAYNFDGFIGNLTLTGIGAANEKIIGATGNDVLSGGDGNDTLVGNDGNDILNGGNDSDLLRGGAGNDTLNGNAGNDTLNGGVGNDKFVFDHGTGQDTVYDFVSGTDQLDLTTIGFANFAAFQAATHDDGDGNAVVDLGGGDTVTLLGVHSNQIQSGDVILGVPQAPLPLDKASGQIGTLDLSAFGFGVSTTEQGATHDAGGNAGLDLGTGDSMTLSGYGMQMDAAMKHDGGIDLFHHFSSASFPAYDYV
ncbi:M10 family metallopeptidase C-terminal domain-containing protein [Sphingomonas bacterium]|uniref:M10 family metallopeptidase C-terminal domain-containing protein n=1 Tax=Sphingomonas bacterium TaxID=1895847 RepID=UPI002629D111|nr:M10 family metallopeptidase C-terminal domain-containing protein [Sphingomonas bacterium]MDB5680122.1 Proprotein convertase [Sphingomonas bacterium]